MSLQRLTPTDRETTAIDEIYAMATNRAPGDHVDCGACGQRHERDALAWWQDPIEPGAWLLTAICEDCQTVELDQVEAAVIRRDALTRKVTGYQDGQPTVFYVTHPGELAERRS